MLEYQGTKRSTASCTADSAGVLAARSRLIDGRSPPSITGIRWAAPRRRRASRRGAAIVLVSCMAMNDARIDVCVA
jgi:hypothetical protein